MKLGLLASSALVLASLATADARQPFPRGGGAGVPPPVGCLQGSNYIDGCPGAPSGTIQYPALLSSYAARPPFNVAGVDYYVGVPAGTTLSDPSTISISGVTVNATAHTVAITGSNITLSGINFGLDNGWKVTDSGANNTIENCLFTAGSNQSTSGFDGLVLALQGSGTTTIVNDELNGNNIAVTAQAGQLVTIAGSGTVIMEYDYIPDAAGDMIDIGGANLTAFDFEYNLIENAASLQTAHGDVIQYYEATIGGGHIDFNTVYQHGSASITGEGILATYNEGSGQTISDMTERDNTLISKDAGDDWGPGTFLENDVGTVHGNNIAVYDNWIDPTAITFTTWYGTGSLGAYETVLPVPSSWYRLTDMLTGALIPIPTKSSPGTDGFYVYPDSNSVSPALSSIYSFAASPSTGNVTTGSTVSITVTMNDVTTVTGTPTMPLNSGGTASYVSGSGTNALVFHYTVGSSDVAPTLGVTSVSGTMKDSVGNATVLSPLTTITTTFAGLSVNEGNSLTIDTTASSAPVSSSAAFTFSYGGSAPGGMSCVWSPGSVAGGAVTSFTASGGTGGGDCPTPSTSGTYTMIATGTSPNTSTASAPNTTVVGSPPPTTVTFTALASARTSFYTSGNGTYTGSAPTTLTAVYGGGCTGTSTVIPSFSGGVWKARFTTPTSACTGTMTVTGTGPNTGTATSPSTLFVLGLANSLQAGPYPGQSGDPVGYSAICAGSLTVVTSFTANTTYHCIEVDAGTSSVNINASGVSIIGAYLGASTGGNNSVQAVTSSGAVQPLLDYVTVGASPSVYGSFPPVPPSSGAWPSGTATVPSNLGNCYGVLSNGSPTPAGGYTITDSDIWGLGNGINFSQVTSANPVTFSNDWVHDNMLTGSQCTHTDGLGDVASRSGDEISHLTVDHSTIAGYTNSNDLALQFHSGDNTIYNNTLYTNNFLAGSSYTIDLGFEGASAGSTNVVFFGNVIGPTPTPYFGQNYSNWTSDFSTSGSGNLWRLNTWAGGDYLCTGGCGTPIGNVPAGYYWYPDGTAHSTDFTGPD